MSLGVTNPFPQKYTELSKTVAATGTPERLYATAGVKLFRQAIIMGCKAAQTDNTADAYLGMTATNGTQAFPVRAGGQSVIEAPDGVQFDFYDFYLDVGVNGEGVQIWYI
jgi:hypothetical protein